MEEHYKPKVLPPSSPKACRQRQDSFEEHLKSLAGSKEGGNEGGVEIGTERLPQVSSSGCPQIYGYSQVVDSK